MTPLIEQMLIAAGATAGGILAAAWFSIVPLRWSKTRAWGDLGTLILIGFLVGFPVWRAFAPTPGFNHSGFLLAGSFFGALLTIRAIFGLVRYSRAEDAGATTYRGSLPDLLLIFASLGAVFVMMRLVGDF